MTSFSLAPEVEDRLRIALRLAAENAFQAGDEDVRPADLIRALFEDAMKVLRKLPDKEAGWIYVVKGMSPQVYYSPAEIFVAEAEAMEQIRLGHYSDDVLVRERHPNAKEISRMEAVFELRNLLVGKNLRRDWIVLCRMADGQQVTKIARYLRCSRPTVYDAQEMQCQAIALKLWHLMPPEVWGNFATVQKSAKKSGTPLYT